MMLLSSKTDVYVKKEVMSDMRTNANKATSVVRILLEGIFTTDALKIATYTGKPCRSQGKERMNEPVVALNKRVVNILIGECFPSFSYRFFIINYGTHNKVYSVCVMVFAYSYINETLI